MLYANFTRTAPLFIFLLRYRRDKNYQTRINVCGRTGTEDGGDVWIGGGDVDNVGMVTIAWKIDLT